MAELLQITEGEVRALAGEVVFVRGNEYFELGQVLWLAEYDGTLAGEVQGQRIYAVNLARSADTLTARCTCPASELTRWCKHGVALGLAYLADTTEAQELYDIAEKLSTWDADDMRAELLRAALSDRSLRERLWLTKVGKQGASLNLARYQREIDLLLSKHRWQPENDLIARLAALLAPLRETQNFVAHDELVSYLLRQLSLSLPRDPAALDQWRDLRDWVQNQRLPH